MIRDLFPDSSIVGSPQRCVQKDVDTSDMEALTVLWWSLCLRVAPNWFLCTDAATDDTSIVFSPYGIPSRNFSVMYVFVRNVHHLSQLPYCFVTVALEILSVVLRMLLVTIYRI